MSRLFTLPKIHFASQVEKCQAAPPGFEPGTFCLPGRCANPCAMVLLSSTVAQTWHFPTCLHLLATLTTQVGLRPQTIVGSAAFLVKLPSWRTLDWKKLTLGAFVIFKGFETTCLAYLHSRKFTLQAKLKNAKPQASWKMSCLRHCGWEQHHSAVVSASAQ